MSGAEIGNGRHGGVHEHGQVDAFSPEKESQAANDQRQGHKRCIGKALRELLCREVNSVKNQVGPEKPQQEPDGKVGEIFLPNEGIPHATAGAWPQVEVGEDERQNAGGGNEKEGEGDQQLVDFPQAKVEESGVALEEQPRKKKVQGHAEGGKGKLQRVGVQPPGACHMVPHHQHDAEAFGKVHKGVAGLFGR